MHTSPCEIRKFFLPLRSYHSCWTACRSWQARTALDINALDAPCGDQSLADRVQLCR